MDLQLEGRLALVTGATKGIGRAAAAQLVHEGAAVIVHGRTSDTVVPVVEALGESGTAFGVWGDLSAVASTSAVLDQVQAIGSPDIVVNNAAQFWAAPFFELTDDDWYRSLETNLMAGVRLARALMPAMLERDWGRVLFIASDYGVQINAALLHYSVAKASLIALARGLAVTAAGTGVTVNSVISGPTWTEGAAGFIDENNPDGVPVEDIRRSFFEPGGLLSDSLIGRYSEPQEIANMIAFLCSPRASSVTGAAQRVEGGTIKAAL
jgi:NAD(P)-dependent dehydrogenase (short-subunit alcohol dehydrogenase family)